MSNGDLALFQARCAALLEAITQHSQALGVSLAEESVAKASALVTWVGYLHSSVTEEHSSPLLKGVKSGIVESVGCISLGLVRPAIFAMRTQVELMHSWIYFNDHRVEWEYACGTGSRYPMISQTRKYLSNYHRRFDQRYSLLLRSKKRQMENPYELLSIHVHAMTVASLPDLDDIHSIVQEETACRECARLQRDVAEFLADTLVAWYADRWADFPAAIMEDLKRRLSNDELQNLFR